MGYRISDNGLSALKRFEGLRLKAYLCPAGRWTIGYGHTQGVHQGQIITANQAHQLLRGDVLPIERYLDTLHVELTQGQVDALCSFAFNLGLGALQRSTLLKYVLMHKPAKDIQAEFKRWVYAGGKVLKGLVARREWEAEQWAVN